MTILIGGLICLGIGVGCSYQIKKCKERSKSIYKKTLQSSIQAIAKSTEFMIYGFLHCKYLDTIRTFDKPGDPFEILCFNSKNTSSGDLEEIPHTGKEISALCKSQLVNLVYENYKREKLGLKKIPLLFFMDVENNPYPLHPKEWTSKKLTTFSEIKRLLKMCNFTDSEYCQFSKEEFEKDKGLIGACKAIERIAREMLIPVRINKAGNITKISLPWEHAEFLSSWKGRKKISSSSSKISWRRELVNKIIQFNHSQKTSKSYAVPC